MNRRPRLRAVRPDGQTEGRPIVLPPRSARVPRLFALITGLSGLITLVSAAFGPMRGRLEVLADVVPLSVRSGATSTAAIAGLGLTVIAGALARRQRRAWAVAVLLLAIAGVAHLLKDLDVLQAGLNLGMAVVLLTAWREFDALPGPGTIRRAVLTFPTLAAGVWVFGMVAILAHRHDLVPTPTIGGAAIGALRGATGFGIGMHVAHGTGRWIPGLLPILGVVVVVVSLAAAFRPVVEGLRRSPSDVDLAGDLVRRFGSDTLAYFALREDKSYFFTGETVTAYRYLWNLGLASGDPVGNPRDVPGAIEAFIRHARRRGWGVAVLAGSARYADVYASLGLRSFYLGDEAIVDPTTFTLEGRRIRKVRQSCHRLERAGYRLEFLSDGEVSFDLREALASVTRSWRGHAPERGFTMALDREPSPRDPDCLTVVARNPEGRADGYLHLVPVHGDEPGFSLDQMRRRPGTPNGLTEWMVASTAVELGRRGASRFSLNFAFLGALFHSQDLSVWQRIEVAAVRPLNPFFQIERLHDFNAKFFPSWEPRYIYYEAPLSLPRVALAYLEAEAFLRLPLIGARGRLRRDGRAAGGPGRPAGGDPGAGESPAAAHEQRPVRRASEV